MAVPSWSLKKQLQQASLGRKKICINSKANAMEVKTKLEESYPKLIARRGFETLRRGPSPSELSVIPPPNSVYNEFEEGFKFTIRCLLLLLEKLVDLSEKFSCTHPLVSRPFTAPATAPYLGESLSGPWDVCSLIRWVASSKKFTALLLRAAMFPTKTVRQSGNILT